ncbi:protein kinase family protein [Streptomyces albogriseolus]|uniref:hypothetical protein n=1 Tax=Streptomyces albogriseolus TaxID=1887 RepID=UPI00381EC371
MEQFAAGKVLRGRYRLDRVLGRGAMGHVWEGTDVFLERPVAVKTVASDLLALPDWRPTALARFEREAKATARLHHANITTVYDAAVTENVCCRGAASATAVRNPWHRRPNSSDRAVRMR